MGQLPLIISITIVNLLFQFSDCAQQFHIKGIEKCPGYCTDNPERCKDRGGRIMGLCTPTLACCDPMISPYANCGDVKRGQRIIHFKSPMFPEYSRGDLMCNVKIEILQQTVATRIDFIRVEMDGPSFVESDDEQGSCESDSIFIRGFGNWAPPARCGNLSGYSLLIDRESPQVKAMQSLSIIALMSSPAYRWHIQVVQLLKKKSKATFGVGGENSVDYEVPFKSKRSLLTPFNRQEEGFTDPDTGASDIVESSALPAEHRSDSDSDGTIDSSNVDVPLILNGEDTLISTVPWQVSLRFDLQALVPKDVNETYYNTLLQEIGINTVNCSSTEGFHFCGGSIIGERYILVASHCFYGTSKTSGMVNISSVKAVVGDTNLCTDDSSKGNELSSFNYFVESVTLHYAYDGQLLLNDIALIKLKSKIKFYSHVQPIIMASSGDEFTGREATVSGWGEYISTRTFSTIKPSSNNSSSTNGSLIETVKNETSSAEVSENDEDEELVLETPNILQSSKKFIIQNSSLCQEKDQEQYGAKQEVVVKHGKYLNAFNSTLCTLGQFNNVTNLHVATGKGDSGGGMIVVNSTESGSVPILVGVVSYGVADNNELLCKPKKMNQTFDYFTSVAFYRSWIDLAITSHENDPVSHVKM